MMQSTLQVAIVRRDVMEVVSNVFVHFLMQLNERRHLFASKTLSVLCTLIMLYRSTFSVGSDRSEKLYF